VETGGLDAQRDPLLAIGAVAIEHQCIALDASDLGSSLTPANPWSATRGTHARGVPTAVCNRLVFAAGMGDG
jgi:hypothetical protein